VTVAFGVSYLFRAAYNTIQFGVGYEHMNSFKNYGGELNFWWSLFLVVFHVFGELVPMLILFMYQYRSNMLYLKNKQLMAQNELQHYYCGADAITPIKEKNEGSQNEGS
jgi:hypothetical protein